MSYTHAHTSSYKSNCSTRPFLDSTNMTSTHHQPPDTRVWKWWTGSILCLAREQLSGGNRDHKSSVSTATPAAARRGSEPGGDARWADASCGERAPSATSSPDSFLCINTNTEKLLGCLWSNRAPRWTPVLHVGKTLGIIRGDRKWIDTSGGCAINFNSFMANKQLWLVVIILLINQIRWCSNRIAGLIKDARGGGEDGSKVPSCLRWWREESVCLRVHCHLRLAKKKRGKKGKEITYRALVSFLWQPEGHYCTLPFIMKGLQCGAARFPCSQLGKQRERNEWVKEETLLYGCVAQEKFTDFTVYWSEGFKHESSDNQMDHSWQLSRANSYIFGRLGDFEKGQSC